MHKQKRHNLQVDDKWVELSESQIFKHPGGPVINQYAGSDATHIFHAFHAGSAKAYKQLSGIKKSQTLTEIESKVIENISFVEDEGPFRNSRHRLPSDLMKQTLTLPRTIFPSNRYDNWPVFLFFRESNVYFEEKKIVASFENLRQEVTRRGWMEGAPLYCCWKIFESLVLLAIVVALQYNGWSVRLIDTTN